jgi:hypothetical protein
VLPLILRQSEAPFPLAILRADVFNERVLLNSLDESLKKQIAEEYWLAMPYETITPELATFTRDFLWLKGPEVVAKVNGLSPSRVVGHFLLQDCAMERALFRCAKAIIKE